MSDCLSNGYHEISSDEGYICWKTVTSEANILYIKENEKAKAIKNITNIETTIDLDELNYLLS